MNGGKGDASCKAKELAPGVIEQKEVFIFRKHLVFLEI